MAAVMATMTDTSLVRSLAVFPSVFRLSRMAHRRPSLAKADRQNSH
jgi:hypothetical protein